ncbi:DEHA2A05148p [Debaryomyces hansenii CBS767]|uniref:DEHA2A05148p n=1 Tax=Debaryomyces hansenii (strain ATCC 36239 / CBS 767 / BCRC 21394 / JCM 1990 / NBRC 0083 / IGC 2968) TaxID=284592 RepID=Q6BZ24_DEBHA|nr:DEHA2A05148p [Debaryomyces hansenii CBS767]CAG84500.2 DEHA2A05148p [Debaryomyces hansenii CBS767]|eukprot:XP_456545.2 DEHA2A05148p [Debaryomyces hansenii CBS767]
MSRRSGRSKAYPDQSELNSEFPEDDEINNYEAEAEDEVDEEQEVTRCICGQDEVNTRGINPQLHALLWKEYQMKIDNGLFIQCDKCSVWQHGYCVGLFINEDVPEKYWCEICKPDLHIFIYDNNETVRSLYKPVNDKRKKLLLENSISQENNNKRNKAKRQAQSNSSPVSASESNKHPRKERRHYDESYDEQLQQALRESAKESGISYDTKNKNKRKKNGDSSDTNKKLKHESEQGQSNAEEAEMNDEIKGDSKLKKSKIKSKSSKSKVAKNPSNDSTSATMTKEELINQASKPRYVNEKSSIYELRKRTGAILEWLGRSQLELEEEKLNKIELFSYKDKIDLNQQQIDQDNNKVIDGFNENLQLMEKLTEKILNWEQQFGKYAP